MIRQNRTDDAEAYLRQIAASTPQNLEAKLLLVDYLVNQRGNAQAEAALREFIAESPAELTYRFSLAVLYMRDEDHGKAIKTYREIIDLDPDGPKNLLARAALAQVFMLQGEKETARALIAEVLSVDSNSVEALFLRARIRLEEGDNRGAIIDLRTLLRQQPELADGRALLAEAHLRNGESLLAIDALRILLEFGPENVPVRVKLAQQLARHGESDTALAMLREALARVPDDQAALRVRAEVYAERGDWPALIDAATAIIEQTPEKALGHHIRGQAFLAQQRYAEASADFAAVLAIEPDALDSMVGLVRSYLGREESKEAESFLLARLADSPRNAALHNLLGELYRATGKQDLAQGAFHTAIRTSKDYVPAYVNLAGEALRAGDSAGAIDIYRAGLAALPENEDLSFALAGTLYLNKDYRAATEIYEAMLDRNRDLQMVANNLASLIADFEYLDFAMLARALELAKPFDSSKNPDYLDTLGWVHYRLGNVQQALSYLEHAVANAPDSPQLQYHLGMTYLATGETTKARRALAQAAIDGADYPGVQVARAALADM